MKKVPKKIPGIEQIKTKTSLRYRASIKINGKLIRRTFKSQSEALSWRDTQRSQRDKNKLHGIDEKNYINFDVLFQYYITSKASSRPTTLANYISVYQNHLKPYIGKKIIRDLSMLDFDKIKLSLIQKDCSTHLINKVTTQLKSILNFAVKRGFLLNNFMQHEGQIKIDKIKYQYWSKEQVNQFLSLIHDDHYYWFYVFAFNTGLRRGELCALKWSNVNFSNHTLTFGLQRLSDGSTQGLKGHQTRTIPLTPGAQKALESIYFSDVKKETYIFLNKRGKPINPDNISKQFRDLQRRLGLEHTMKFHGIRHTFASYLASTGVSIQIIQKLLGHTDVKVTLRYSHLTVDDLKRGIVNFDL